MKSSGAFFTWNNKTDGTDRVQSKIDRVLINTEWLTQMPAAEVHFMTEGAIYNNCPTIIKWEQRSKGGRRQFRYFNMWSLAPEFKTKVQENWEKSSEGRHMFKVVGKLNRLRKVLKTLNRNRFSETETRADLAMEKLRQCQDRIQLNPLNMDLYMEENKLSQEARLLEKAKFQFLRQKSKMQWLKEGDQNTKFFHNYLKARRSNNRIFIIKDTNGVQHTSIDDVSTLVNEAQRDELTREFAKEEVKQTLWAIDGNKSPGLDGYGSKFFKNCWGIVGEDVTKGILEYFQNGEMLRWVNDTVITLIPKGVHTENVTCFLQHCV
ncbi:hypothetical protein KY290_034023 [Solanum tuberosum]|uniref:Reverse transcriptase n=1 Tax=Solanum tuberosum TaxID=4113 RepID=A0ABQ7U276_SOLTU|nr:hypothetical protein KY289_033404 [Solanum tuberosum]KAH0649335.1 hypothetical protein KY285_034583 [Solanum tuberosum]KAH0740980.1 hypothetical protein KY290_034023 [Solanum tuberosum]